MKIQVLGSGCPTCEKLHQAVLSSVKNLNLDIEVEYSNDITKIVELGAMSSPVFAIDNVIVTAGHVPSNAEIEKAILGMSENNDDCCDSPQGGCYCGGKC